MPNLMPLIHVSLDEIYSGLTLRTGRTNKIVVTKPRQRLRFVDPWGEPVTGRKVELVKADATLREESCDTDGWLELPTCSELGDDFGLVLDW